MKDGRKLIVKSEIFPSQLPLSMLAKVRLTCAHEAMLRITDPAYKLPKRLYCEECGVLSGRTRREG
jgi:hypothetical protein